MHTRVLMTNAMLAGDNSTRSGSLTELNHALHVASRIGKFVTEVGGMCVICTFYLVCNPIWISDKWCSIVQYNTELQS